MFEGKNRALAFDRLLPYGTSGKNNNVPKDLFGEVPMLGSGAPTDIGRVKKRRNQNPRVLNDLFGFTECELDCDVGSRSDTPQPALPGPAGKQLCRFRPGNCQRHLDILYMQDVACRIDNGGKP